MANDTTVLQSAPPVFVVNNTANALSVNVANGYKGPDGAGAHTSVSFDASVQSAAITGSFVDVWADQDCYINVAANPTATSANYALPKTTLVRFPITSGNKIAALKISTAGTLHINVVA